MKLKKLIKLPLLISAIGVLASCQSESQMKEQISKVLKENPALLFKVIEDNPADFMEVVQKAAKNSQKDIAKRRDEDEKKKIEESFKNPLKPVIRDDNSFRGVKDAPLVLVEYSDFECPFCSRGYNTVTELLKKYKGKIKFIYKHLPLSFHKNAMIASEYFEAIRLQNPSKAYDFHDEIFKNQRQLKNGEKFLKSLAKKVGADMKRLAKDLKSEIVKQRIAEDMKEAAKFGMQGTPGFLINGVPVRGAYPASHFDTIIEKLKAKTGLKL